MPLTVFDAEIDAKGRLRVPPAALKSAGWEVTAGLAVTFELTYEGAARVLPGSAYEDAFAAAQSARDDDSLKVLSAILHRGSWETGNRLNPIPRIVRAHVLETGAIVGPMFVAVEGLELALWGNACRLRRLRADREMVRDYLPP